LYQYRYSYDFWIDFRKSFAIKVFSKFEEFALLAQQWEAKIAMLACGARIFRLLTRRESVA
jgi:hypothetical protein